MMIETGFFSFFAAGSTLYYLDKKASDGWNMDSPTVGPIPSTSDNTGINHNLTCELFFAGGYTTVTYDVMVQLACQVRPVWTAEIEAISESSYNNAVAVTLTQDMSTVAEWMALTTSKIPLNNSDSATVNSTFTTIQNADHAQWVSSLATLITDVNGFALTASQKQSFVNALQILQLS